MQKNTFTKEERLCSRQLIDSLFTGEGVKKISDFPLLLIYREVTPETSEVPVQVMFSVSKRKIKLAVKRNLLKRRLRESYRKHKHKLIDTITVNNKHVLVSIIYLEKKPLPYNIIEKKIIVLLNRLKNECEEVI